MDARESHVWTLTDEDLKRDRLTASVRGLRWIADVIGDLRVSADDLRALADKIEASRLLPPRSDG